ncbi:MAG: primosomal protein N' [Rickettsiales bacterium]
MFVHRIAVTLSHSKCLLDYKHADDLELGQIVSITVRNKDYLGAVYLNNITSEIEENKLKSISKVFSGCILPTAIMSFIEKLSRYTLNSFGTILKMYLPNEDILKSKKTDEIEVKESYQFKIPTLNNYQEGAFCVLRKQCEVGYSANLLFGVTGSGKTEIYLKILEEKYKNQGGQFLILLPEIALTNNMVRRFEKRFGSRPRVWHSGATKKEKREIFSRIISGEDIIVVGARSSLFLPFKRLSLIVVDEEHDQSYKQEESPTYNARDASVLLANISNIPIILASATPSLETYNNTKNKKYNIVEVNFRHLDVELPDVIVEDLHKAKLPIGKFLTPNLIHQIDKTLKEKKQVMLFLNRKGFAPITICSSCGFCYKCDDCSSTLVYHQSRKEYVCHYCGQYEKVQKLCPSCSKENSMRYCGAGVEKIKEEVSRFFPEKNIATLTSENAKKQGYVDLFKKIENQEIDIIIGTQIIGKGHHFSNITLVGVVDADIGILDSDLRAGEKSYQMISQVVGRSGREKKGKALIQTFYPKSPVVTSVCRGDYKKYYDQELDIRNETKMPPFGRLVSIIVSSPSKEKLLGFIKELDKNVIFSKYVKVLGPVEAPIFKINKNFRYRFLLKSGLKINIQDYVKEWLKNVPVPHNIFLKIDVDPYNFL